MQESTSESAAVQSTPRVVLFALERTTKGAIRFHEVDDAGSPVGQADATLGTVYVRKSVLNGATPKQLRVTVEFLDG